MITYSTPCQDFSSAGKQAGGDKGSGTRSSLLWECERIIRAVKPKYLLMENVKNLLSEKHRHNFNEWFKVLESMGYTNYYKVLNAKDYGVPQNRERVFVVSILSGGQYLFPNKIKLEKKLKDILEPVVDEKYYLSDRFVNQLLKQKDGLGYKPCINGEVAVTLTTKPGQRNSDNYIQEPFVVASRGRNIENPSVLTSVQKDNYVFEPQVLTPKRTEYGKQIRKSYESGLISESRHNMTSMELRDDGITNTLTTIVKDNYVVQQIGSIIETDSFGRNPQSGRIYSDGYRIRKLTPRECFRLMGVKDEQFDRLQGLSNTQLYKLAGNSIVVNVLEAIFKNLLMPEQTDTKGQLRLI